MEVPLPRHVHCIAAALACALGLGAAPLEGQDSVPAKDSAFVLPPIEVTASILPSASPDPGSGVPARTLVVEALERRAWAARSAPDLLAGRSAMSLYDDLGSPFKTTLSSRGFFASPVVGLPQGISVFLDGIPVNEPDAAQVNFDLLPLAHVRRVELLNGTASLLGPNSLGGAVNLMTYRGGGPLRGEIELQGGSHGARSAGASVSGAAGAWSYYGGGGYATEDGWRDFTGAESWNGFVNLGRGTDRAGVNLQMLRADSRGETAGSLPLSVFEVRPDSNLSAGDFEDLDSWHVALSGYVAAAGGRASGALYFRSHDAERFNVNQIDDPDVRSFSENRTLGTSLSWLSSRRVGRGTLGFRVGGGGSVNDVHIMLLAERIDPGLTTDVKSDIADVHAYGTAEYAVGRLTASAALRWDYVRVPFTNRLDRAKDTTSSYARLSPSLGALLRIGRGGEVYASVGQSFRAPAVIELACADPEEPCPLPFALGDDPPLDPVRATTVEGGVRHLLGALSLDASVFRTWVRDDIFLFPYQEADEPEGSTIDGYFGNLGDTRREGIELAAAYAPVSGVAVHATYGHTRATFQVDGVEIFSIREAAGASNEVERGDRFPLVPAHRLTGGVTVALPAGFSAGAVARYVGEQYLRGDEANDEAPLGAYLIADARLMWERDGWTVLGVVTNLFGSADATFGTFNINQTSDRLERFLTPVQPRQVKVAVRRRFGG
jgi:outer membrane cobalamin receptor